jgi:hypothetical protein
VYEIKVEGFQSTQLIFVIVVIILYFLHVSVLRPSSGRNTYIGFATCFGRRRKFLTLMNISIFEHLCLFVSVCVFTYLC